MEVKKTISMAEFGAIVNVVVSKCFENGYYDPVYRDFWLKYAVIVVLSDYPFEDKDIEEVWDEFQTNEDVIKTWEAISIVYEKVLDDIHTAVSRSIDYKNRINNYSMTDMALTNLIDAISAKIDSVGDLFTEENIQALVDASGKLSKLNNVSQKKIISAIIDSFDKRNIKTEIGSEKVSG